MKHWILLSLILFSLSGKAQHTFSIVAVDSITGEIGSAGATCLFFKDAALDISDIVLGVGAIHTQAWWDSDNQSAAHDRMVAGDSPEEIITWLQNNDVGSYGGGIQDRQYGVVDLNDGHPRSAAFTGDNNFTEKGHRLGNNYSIQGNILISQEVLNDMENAFLTSTGPLCDKLMAVMQAAKRPGADARCLDEGWSSGSAFIRVAKPTDTDASYGNLWLDISLYTDSGLFTGDPIDELQVQFDAFKASSSTGDIEYDAVNIYPNPSDGYFQIDFNDVNVTTIEVIDVLGKVVMEKRFQFPPSTLDLRGIANGVYYMNCFNSENNYFSKKIVISK